MGKGTTETERLVSDSGCLGLQQGGFKRLWMCVWGRRGVPFMLGAESGSIFTHRVDAFAELA